jgi:hypothetical protein
MLAISDSSEKFRFIRYYVRGVRARARAARYKAMRLLCFLAAHFRLSNARSRAQSPRVGGMQPLIPEIAAREQIRV